MAKQLAFYFDSTACTDCKACVIACKDRSSLPVGVNWRRVYQYVGGSWMPSQYESRTMVPINVFSYSLSIACMHCEKPLCAEICPAKAITKDEQGIVAIDTSKCIGCRYCEWACPYDAPQFHEELGVMTKCDFCKDLLAQGGNPACVDACVMRCLHYGELEELRAKYGSNVEIAPLPRADITLPAFVLTPHKSAQATGEGTGWLDNLPEEL